MNEIKRILMTKSGKKFYVKDMESDFHTQYGFVKKEELTNNTVITNSGVELYSFAPTFSDLYRKIKRLAQIIPLKDVGTIIAETGVTKDSVVVDAGVGSGALSIFMAVHAKEVYSYDIRDDHIKIATKNIENLNIKNIKIANHDIYENIPVKDIDVITLDVPEPWKVIAHAKNSLKQGGFLVSYSPCIPQVADFVNALKTESDGKIIHLKTIEIYEREWDVDGRKVRPKSRGMGHSGFLTFTRKV